jgi:hypothetical protein
MQFGLAMDLRNQRLSGELGICPGGPGSLQSAPLSSRQRPKVVTLQQGKVLGAQQCCCTY